MTGGLSTREGQAAPPRGTCRGSVLEHEETGAGLKRAPRHLPAPCVSTPGRWKCPVRCSCRMGLPFFTGFPPPPPGGPDPSLASVVDPRGASPAQSTSHQFRLYRAGSSRCSQRSPARPHPPRVSLLAYRVCPLRTAACTTATCKPATPASAPA